MPIPHLLKKPKTHKGWRTSNQPSSTYSSPYSVKKTIQQSRYSRRAGKMSDYKGYGSRKYKRRGRKTLPATIIYYVLIIFLISTVVGAIYFAWLSKDLPDPNKLIDRDIAESTKIYDRTGETILYEVHGAQKRTIIQLEDIPDYMKYATITAEDRTFYEHSGFNFLALIRSVLVNPLKGKRIAGGSTLTQQLVKNAILTSERKVSRKVKELVLSYRIEKKFSKDEILQMYFNEIPYGSTAYGIEAAARRYFGISAKDVNLAQAAVLAAIPKAPTYYSPYGNNIDKLIDRQQYILEEMEDLGYIDEQDLEVALGYDLEFQEPTESITAPHFVMYVREIISAKYGEQAIEQEGFRIYTTLDLYKQEIAEEVIAERGEKNAQEYQATNASLVSLDPKTGQILAMIGSRDYFNDEIDGQVNVTMRPRQPGSSLKPIVYAVAFEKGYTPNTILYDVVTDFAAAGKSYTPHNYDLKEHGPVSMRKALAGSLNIPAVKTLYLVSPEKVVEQAQKMGYTTLTDPERYGLSLVLGGGEVKLLEHTAAYGVLAREGQYFPPVAILRVEDRKGKILEEWKEEDVKEVMAPEIARLINNILSDNNARAYAFGVNNWLTLRDRPVAAKTGTTNDYRDAWTIGYTPSLVTGVWVGNNDNTEMKRGAAGGVVAAPIWHNYMQRVLGDTPAESFRAPEIEPTGKAILDGTDEGKIKVKIDKISGLLATENTPPELIEEKEFIQPHSILYYCDKDDPRGEEPRENSVDPQFAIWEEAIQDWAQKNELTLETAPTNYDPYHKPENIPQVVISSPINNASVRDKNLQVDITVANAPLGIGRAEYYVDDYLISLVANYPFDLNQDISYLTNGEHKLTVKVCDTKENCWQGIQKFNLALDETQRDTTLSISWQTPSNNSNISKAQFPLQLKVLTFKPNFIKEINFYYLVGNSTTPNLIANNKNVIDNEIITYWSEAPAELGPYRVYAEAIGWSNNTLRTPEIKIKIEIVE